MKEPDEPKKKKPQRLVHARVSVKMIFKAITDKPNTSHPARKRKGTKDSSYILRGIQNCIFFVLIGLIPLSGDTGSQAPPSCGLQACYMYNAADVQTN